MLILQVLLLIWMYYHFFFHKMFHITMKFEYLSKVYIVTLYVEYCHHIIHRFLQSNIKNLSALWFPVSSKCLKAGQNFGIFYLRLEGLFFILWRTIISYIDFTIIHQKFDFTIIYSFHKTFYSTMKFEYIINCMIFMYYTL